MKRVIQGAGIRMATSRDRLFVVYSLLYPIRVYSTAGTLADGLGWKPPSFRRASRVEAGAFAGTGARERLRRWLGSFDVIAGLAVVADTLLVVTHTAGSRPRPVGCSPSPTAGSTSTTSRRGGRSSRTRASRRGRGCSAGEAPSTCSRPSPRLHGP